MRAVHASTLLTLEDFLRRLLENDTYGRSSEAELCRKRWLMAAGVERTAARLLREYHPPTESYGDFVEWFTKNVSPSWIAAPLSIRERVSHCASILGMPETVSEEALKIADIIGERKLHTGRSVDAAVAAALITAARIYRLPYSAAEIADVASTSESPDLWRNLDVQRLARRALKLHQLIKRHLRLKTQTPSAIDFARKYGARTGLSRYAIAEAEKILREAKGKNTNNGSPHAIAAAALYIAAALSGERRTQEEIATTAGITTQTLRRWIRKLAPENYIII